MKSQYYIHKYRGCKFKNRIIFNKGEIKIHRFGVTIITGKNGTGKSTLLNKIYRVSNNAGTFVAQENEEIFENLSVLQNITFMRHGILDDTVKSLISKYGLEGILEKDCRTLSGGEKRIISLLRGIASDDEIIFMDEPTNDLDFRIVTILQNIINDYKDKKTFIIVTHDERLLSLATSVYKIEDKELILEYNQRDFEEQIAYTKNSKNITNNRSFIKKIIPIDICNYLSVIFVTIISLCFFLNIMGRMNYIIERVDEKQVELCNTLYKSSEELIRNGYIPTYLISFINEDMSASELEEKVQKILNDSEKQLYSLSLDIKPTDDYNVYTLELFDLQSGIQYSVLDVCLEEIYNKDREKYYMDTSSYFQINNKEGVENKKAIAFEDDIYESAMKWIGQQSETDLENAFIVIQLLNQYNFEKFITDPELAELWDANYYIRSNETIYLAETAIRMNGYKSVIKMWGMILLMLLIITVINTVLYIHTLKKSINILANYGVDKQDILKAVDNRCVNKKWMAVVIFLTELIMLIAMLIYRNTWDVRELVIPVIYLFIMIALNILQKILLNGQIGKKYRVEGEFEC